MKISSKKMIWVPMVAVGISSVVYLSACSKKQAAEGTTVNSDANTQAVREKMKKSEVWTCPMHPQIRKDGPGTCPICGMTLVKVSELNGEEKADDKSADESSGDKDPHADHREMPDGHAAFRLSAARSQMIGVKFGVVEKKPLFKLIEAAGRVAFDPELYTAQNEFLEALKQEERVKDSPIADVKHSAERMAESAKLRLKILGLSDAQIAAIRNSGSSGGNLLIPKPGESLWIYAEVFEQDLASIHPGLEAVIGSGATSGNDVMGKVVSVDRVINPATRTAKVRISVPNAKLRLRPEAYVDVTIRSPLGEQVTVPFDAVFDTGKQTWVFVTDGKGHFDPRLVTLRYRADDEVAIASGLQAGEKIVTSANFLIDSESRLKGVLAGQGGTHQHE